MSETFDILVVGGGINGAGIARDAAGRGQRVLLCEAGDLGGATSSASSKLIHGGLRYLEQYRFRLVREALHEREVLMRLAPHLVRPLRFVLPHGAGSRPRAMIRAGLFLYDHLGGRGTLPKSHAVRLDRTQYGAPLRAGLRDGFVYSDCAVDDTRLVVLNARDAKARGAEILTRTRLVSASRAGDLWRAQLVGEGGFAHEIAARVLVNAAGPWVGDVIGSAGVETRAAVRLVKGSHIVVPRLYEGKHAYILQNDDRRVVFVIPYEGEFSLIGTTDVPFSGDPADVRIAEEEIAYLCRAVSLWFRRAVDPASVHWSYSGVRPLYDDEARDASSVTRDYVLDLDEAGPPALSVFGGKITTYRRLAEHALQKLARHLPGAGPAWTTDGALPGAGALDAAALRLDYPFLDEGTARRLAHLYGGEARTILAGARNAGDLGRDFGHGLFAREVEFLVAQEWARTAEDILWRRTKLGLGASARMVAELESFLERAPVPGEAD